MSHFVSEIRPAAARIAVGVGMSILAGGMVGCADSTPDTNGGGRVTNVVDGDTLRVSVNGRNERVRLIGIDTPETHGKDGLRECFGQQASDNMAKMVPVGTRVRLVRDRESRDRYERLLAYVYRSKDNVFVNLEQVRLGYADDFPYPPNTIHAAEFATAKQTAQAYNAGLWKQCGNADVEIDRNG